MKGSIGALASYAVNLTSKGVCCVLRSGYEECCIGLDWLYPFSGCVLFSNAMGNRVLLAIPLDFGAKERQSAELRVVSLDLLLTE